ncbi:MAG TPA: serine/threonine-protein kinase [Polyangiaceae bacterium]|nr:serine/threonine-protein kinase [Polyangiaceae bacterium]
MIQQGELLAGKYRVEQVLGAGGMGYVVAAMHEQLGQRVAVKLLVPELCENEDSVMRFLREARAAVKIHSEHVARVIDVGELTNGSPYMVMEFLNGRDLADELDQPDAVLPVEVAIDYVLQASEAVAEAHSLGVIHRDLKPANLFLTHRPDGSPLVKVLDFGISKAINTDENALEPAPSLTATHSLLGSPAYMSPEQIRRPKQVDTRTDIWSLGSILYELLTKDPPFTADSPLALLAAVVSDPLPSIRDKRPDVPVELEAVIAKCLEKNPDNRYQTVAELADALAPFAPRSQPSISRISGILRATSLRPPAADKSPSSERTLQSPGTPKFGTPISEQATEEVKVKVITPAPAARSTKNTNTDWVATPSMVASRRRTAVVTLAALAAVVVGIVVLWLRPSPAPTEATPDPSTIKVTPRSAPALEAPARSAAAAPAAPETPPAVAAASVAPAAPSVIPSAATPVIPAKNGAKLAAKAAPAPAVAPAPAAPTAAPVAPAPPKAAIADPLDGRR